MTIAASQYLRASTEHQQYSLKHQSDAIEYYARQHGFQIVQTYCDAGRSGVLLRNRPGLIRLLDDVMQTNRLYSAILVYDVSRWGRFQDCDEAAHYEFICKHAGVPVHYCAEGFTNDSSLPDSIFKALKRSMAAEYSREMSVRCFAAAQRFVRMGFKQGGSSGYGLRRLMVSADGKRKKILLPGERKSVRTDRVILIPGPRDEVARVGEIYRLLVEENRTPYYITHEMNRRSVPCPRGKWRVAHVCRILTDPKYAGHNVWNRTTGRLGQPRAAVPKANWIIKPGVFDPIISPTTFCEAQQALADQRRSFTDEELIIGLRRILREKGTLSYPLVKNCFHTASVTTLIKHFGSLRHAFERAGHTYAWTASVREYQEQTKCLRQQLLYQISNLFPVEVSIFQTNSQNPESLCIDNSLVISVFVCPVLRRKGCLTWIADNGCTDRKNPALVARMNRDNSAFLDFFVLPRAPRHWIRHRGELKNGQELLNLAHFCSVARLVADYKTKLATQGSAGRNFPVS